MAKPKITGHMIVKNEDKWVWFAVQSVLPYLDKLLITDTGSTDNTVQIIRELKSDKIVFKQKVCRTATEVTLARQEQINETTTPWIWTIDGDEIYTSKGAEEVVKTVSLGKYDIILARRYDLLGDIYHRQKESVGTYSLFGQHGHLLVRLVNQARIKGLNYQGDYPLEGYYDGKGVSILEYDPQKVYSTNNYLYHAMYLKRSSIGKVLPSVFNRSKYRVETGFRIEAPVPEVFSLPRPQLVPDPKVPRTWSYELAAALITPLKNLKRKIL